MYRLKLVVVLLLLVAVGDLSAQQLPTITQYRENHSLLNPASIPLTIARSDGELSQNVGVSYRYQWLGLQDAPRTFTASYDKFWKKYNYSIGGTILNDQTGPTSMDGAWLRYGYHWRLNRDLTVSGGLAGGLFQYHFRASEGETRDSGDAIGESDLNSTQAQIQLGLFLIQRLNNNSDLLYGGLSIPQLFDFDVMQSDEDILSLEREPHYYATIGWLKELNQGSNNLFIEPSLWVKYIPNAPLQTDANIRLLMVDLFWIGGGYSISIGDIFSTNHIHLETGFIIGNSAWDNRQLMISYGYGRGINNYGPIFGNIHEINLSFSWK